MNSYPDSLKPPMGRLTAVCWGPAAQREAGKHLISHLFGELILQ